MSQKAKKIILTCAALFFFSCFIIYISYQCPNNSIFCKQKSSSLKYLEALVNEKKFDHRPTFEEVVDSDFQFDIEGHDVMVFLHMQKTGGTTFGKHLVKDLELQRKCVCHRKRKKRCTCLRPGINSEETWLFSRYSTGWKCGLHADWTELSDCVEEVMNKIDDKDVERRYFYITYLRNPIHRYMSEYKHVGRGATWRATRLFCGGRSATQNEVPKCYYGHFWEDLTIEKFYSCNSNLANNRQTRMLADLTLVNCYNTSRMSTEERNRILLASAKRNLDNMVFFGLTEFQEKSQYIFEETFNFKFNARFEQYNQTYADDILETLTKQQLNKIKEANSLDLELYEYAKKIFEKRYEKLKSLDTEFEDHFNNMGHRSFVWESIDKDR